jgi:hypothetical protein
MESYIKSCISLFNSIPLDTEDDSECLISELAQYGYIVNKTQDYAIVKKVLMDMAPNLNKTFFESWKTIVSSTSEDLALKQLFHYITVHMSDIMVLAQDEIYIPNKHTQFGLNLTLTRIHGVPRSKLISKAKQMLYSKLPTTIDTAKNIITVLGDEPIDITSITNKETLIMVCVIKGIVPSNKPEDILRYIIYITTKTTLLIKNKKLIQLIEASTIDVSQILEIYNVQLSTIFNRFKPLFLAFKSRHATQINRISRLSKHHHVPMVESPLANVKKASLDNVKEALTHASIFTILKLYKHLESPKLYFIRNQTLWCDLEMNYKFDAIKQALVEKLSTKEITIQKGVDPSIPVSEKLFSGHYPTGTSFEIVQNFLIAIYWKDTSSRVDLDLSCIDSKEKIGWDGERVGKEAFYSGDMTSAPNGACEVIYVTKNLTRPKIIMCNNYHSNKDDSVEAQLIIAQTDDTPLLELNHIIDPSTVIATIPIVFGSNQKVLGIVRKCQFTMIDKYMGDQNVSSWSPLCNAIIDTYRTNRTLRTMADDLNIPVKEVDEVVAKSEYIKMLE